MILQVGSQRVQIVFEGAEGVLSTTPGRYCPEFGQVIPTTVLEFRAEDEGSGGDSVDVVEDSLNRSFPCL